MIIEAQNTESTPAETVEKNLRATGWVHKTEIIELVNNISEFDQKVPEELMQSLNLNPAKTLRATVKMTKEKIIKKIEGLA